MKIEVWSDIVCPFCFLGKRKLEQSIERLGIKGEVDIVWRSFQLDPDFPEGKSIPSSQYLSERKGYPVNQIQQIQMQLKDQALFYGIDFQFEKALTFNTIKAHQLLHWSSHFGKSTELKEVFLKAYFTDSMDLSIRENLVELVGKVDLDKDQAMLILKNGSYKDEVESDFYQARQIGLRGVPFFLINNQSAISGAQSDQVFDQVLQTELIKNGIPLNSASEGACSVDEGCN